MSPEPVPAARRLGRSICRIFDTLEDCSAALATRVSSLLGAALAARASASLVVPGGRTPARFLRALSCASLDWERVWLTLTDERWVDPDAPESNERMVRAALRDGAASRAHFIGLKTASPLPGPAAQEVAARLGALPRPFDAAVLGMGDDGHIASLFPADRMALTCGSDCIAIGAAAGRGPRMSLTLAALLDSRAVFILFGGAAKFQLLRQASRPGPAERFPVRAMLRQSAVPVEFYAFRRGTGG